MDVVWTDLAISSLRETNEFILEVWNQKVSDKFVESIDNQLDQLILNPNIGKNVTNTSFKKVIIHKHISLFYQLYSNQIKVLLIWDNRQNPKKLSQKIKTVANT